VTWQPRLARGDVRAGAGARRPPSPLGAGVPSNYELHHTTITDAVSKFLSTVTDRQIMVIASDGSLDRAGDILEPYGAQLDNYRRNPIILAQHDIDQPIGRCRNIRVENGAVQALVEFPALGISELADQYCRLYKAGVMNAVSVGFIPLEWQPLRGGGRRFTRWELLELSLVSVPANANALVMERAYSGGADALNRIRRQLRLLHLGRKTDTPAERRAFVEQLGHLYHQLAAYDG